MNAQVKDMKRYNLALPDNLARQLEEVAKAQQMSVVQVFRQAIKVYLLILNLMKNPNTRFIVRDGDVDKELVLFLE